MQAETISFSTSNTTFYFEASFSDLATIVDPQNCFVITDTNVFAAHAPAFNGWQTLVLEAGEDHKIQPTVDHLIDQLIAGGADRTTTLVGVGGGVVTDITGYVASVFLRGLSFGFVPTTVLAMVDAAIGGKNGIDVGVYKNMVGTITQPRFLLYDMGFLKSLPDREWRNGFAEIIKHAAIKDVSMFAQLEEESLQHYQQNNAALQQLIRKNVLIKARVVQQDEREGGERRLLNFGHTLGHALEKNYQLMHGEAVAIGMVFAATLSSHICGFEKVDALKSVIQQYGLPVEIAYDRETVFDIMKRDKKKESDALNFVLLKAIGEAVVQKIPLPSLNHYL